MPHLTPPRPVTTLPLDDPALVQREADLLARTRAGDPDAFAEIYRRLLPSAGQYARRRVAACDVDDVVAEAFTRVLRALSSGNGPFDNPMAYVRVAIRTTAASLHATRAREADELARHGRGPTSEEAVTWCDDDRLVAAFGQLSERWRQVIWWTEVEGLTPAEVGERLGLSDNAVAALGYRARRGLREAYLELAAADLTADRHERLAG